MSNEDIGLIAHLTRRAGFGASRDELDAYAAKGYEATVEALLDFREVRSMPEDLIRRYHHDYSAMFESAGSGASWLYRVVSTSAPLQEKMVLFWHGVFATGYAKVPQGKVLMDQLRMFRRRGAGSFRTLLEELSRDPAMIIWLDNQENHKGAINENYGRELLELFSMGAGNYSEQESRSVRARSPAGRSPIRTIRRSWHAETLSGLTARSSGALSTAPAITMTGKRSSLAREAGSTART